MEQEKKSKSFLHTLLENTDWKTIYEECYGKLEIQEELPKGKELRKRFYSPRWWKDKINKPCGS